MTKYADTALNSSTQTAKESKSHLHPQNQQQLSLQYFIRF